MYILIVRNNYNPQAVETSLLLETYLHAQGIKTCCLDTDDLRYSAAITASEKIQDISCFDMAVVLGGDGTILRTAAQIKYRRIPILGVNFGSLGFMANPNESGVIPAVAAALADELTKEYRTNLFIEVEYDQDRLSKEELEGIAHNGQDEDPHEFFALNELVVARGAQGRIIDFTYSVSDDKIADMRGDGLVIATATGSSAYALSAGGPLTHPSFKGLIIVPVAPHSLHSRAVITDSSDIAEINLNPTSANREASMFIDGELIRTSRPIRRIVVRTGEEPTILLRYQAKPFYSHVSEVFFR